MGASLTWAGARLFEEIQWAGAPMKTARNWQTRFTNHGIKRTGVQMSSMRILIVDDERDVRSALRRSLRGQTVHAAADAKEALKMLKELEVDVVISDLDMEGMCGIDFLQHVRLTYPGITRILLTGRATVDLAVKALNQKAAHRFLLKPWSKIDLLGTIAITRSGTQVPATAKA